MRLSLPSSFKTEVQNKRNWGILLSIFEVTYSSPPEGHLKDSSHCPKPDDENDTGGNNIDTKTPRAICKGAIVIHYARSRREGYIFPQCWNVLTNSRSTAMLVLFSLYQSLIISYCLLPSTGSFTPTLIILTLQSHIISHTCTHMYVCEGAVIKATKVLKRFQSSTRPYWRQKQIANADRESHCRCL